MTDMPIPSDEMLGAVQKILQKAGNTRADLVREVRDIIRHHTAASAAA